MSGSLGIVRIIALALCIGVGIAIVYANVRSWELEDANAYWNAAERLRHGEPLYVLVDPAADETIAYRYAPWLAWLWVPLTYLPRLAVQVGWSALLIAAAAVALWPLARIRSAAAICLLFLLGGLLVRTASTGNIHVLLIAALVWGLPRRSGPVWVGVAASLKIAPLAYVLVYLGRRQWRRAGVALFVSGLLFAPALLYDLSHYPVDPGESFSLLSLAGPLPWALVAGGAALGTLLLSATRFGWSSAAVAVIAATPRLDYYDLTYLLVGLNARPKDPPVSTVDQPVAPPVRSRMP